MTDIQPVSQPLACLGSTIHTLTYGLSVRSAGKDPHCILTIENQSASVCDLLRQVFHFFFFLFVAVFFAAHIYFFSALHVLLISVAQTREAADDSQIAFMNGSLVPAPRHLAPLTTARKSTFISSSKSRPEQPPSESTPKLAPRK